MNDQSQSELEDRDALFYPYIHFRDVEWLKRTLLVFPHIVRMVPEQYVPQDNPFVQQLSYAETRRGPLVRRAELFTPDVILAQRQLKAKLQRDLEHHGDDFIRRFGRATTDAEKPPGDRGFQMHRAKTMPELIPFLEERGLAWEPTHPDDYNYCELHPRIGQAVLSTIAIACAQDEGLDVVTDPADQESRMLDDHLATEGKDRIYEAWVHHASDGTKRAKKPDGSAILKVLVYQHADPTKLTVEGLKHLSDDREALARLRRELASMATTIPAMRNETKLKDRLQEQAEDALTRWRADRLNMSTISRQMLGAEAIEVSAGIAEKISEQIATHGFTLSLAGVSTLLLGAGPGVAILLVAHAASSVLKARKREKKSPFRYLTKLEEAGVVFSVAP